MLLFLLLFLYNPQYFFCLFHFSQVQLSLFSGLNYFYQSEWIVGTLCAQLILSFYDDSFGTLQVLLSWSEDMHVCVVVFVVVL